MPVRSTRMSAGVAAVCLLLAVMGCNPPTRMSLEPLPSPELDLSAPVILVAASAPSRAEAPGESEWSVPDPRPWKYIVIHHSASDNGNSQVFDRMHRARGFDELGYHFVITNGNGGSDGVIEVGTRWERQKWGAHTGGTPNNEYNNFGIGICVVGDFSRKMPTDAELVALKRLVSGLMDMYDIKPANVIGHRDAPNATTDCPGDRFHEYLKSTFLPWLARRAAGE